MRPKQGIGGGGRSGLEKKAVPKMARPPSTFTEIFFLHHGAACPTTQLCTFDFSRDRSEI